VSLHLHAWTLWVPYERYIDVSWGSNIPSTSMIRRCSKCGLVKTKHRYGLVLPIDERAVDAVLSATHQRRNHTRFAKRISPHADPT